MSIPASPVFKLSADGMRYEHVASDKPTKLAAPPGLPFSLVFRAEPGKEDVLLEVASAYEMRAAAAFRRPPFRHCDARPQAKVVAIVMAMM